MPFKVTKLSNVRVGTILFGFGLLFVCFLMRRKRSVSLHPGADSFRRRLITFIDTLGSGKEGMQLSQIVINHLRRHSNYPVPQQKLSTSLYR